MAQALSISFVTEPPTSRTPIANSPGNNSTDNGPSKFDDALDSARQKNSADPSSASAPANSTDPSSKPAKAKPAKTAHTKPANKSRASKNDATDDSQPDESAADSAAKTTAPITTTEPAPAADDTHPGNAKADPKAKNALNPDPSTDAQSPQLAVTPQQIPDTRTIDARTGKPSDAPADPPSPTESVQAIQQTSASQTDDTPVASENAAAPAKPAGGSQTASAAGLGASKLGAPALRGKGANEDSSQSVSPNDAATAAVAAIDADASDDAADPQASGTEEGVSTGAASKTTARVAGRSFADTLFVAQDQGQAKAAAQPGSAAAPQQAPPTPREIQFADANHDRIVSDVHTQLLPNGGSMQIRLDPPELGALNVSVHMKDGVMTATFETSSDQASRLLSHSLGQLKTALESEGVTVGRLHVQQAPRDSEPRSSQDGKNGDGQKQSASQQQQEQQRREMLRRMWRRVNGGKDPLDLVA